MRSWPCLLAELARSAGFMPLATFDRDLAKVDGARIDYFLSFSMAASRSVPLWVRIFSHRSPTFFTRA